MLDDFPLTKIPYENLRFKHPKLTYFVKDIYWIRDVSFL